MILRLIRLGVFVAPFALIGCIASGIARGQCRGGSCGVPAYRPSYSPAYRPVVVVQSAPAPALWEWRELPSDPGRVYLYRDGVRQGGYDLDAGYYRPVDPATGQWGPSSADSVAAKSRAGTKVGSKADPQQTASVGATAQYPTGVQWDRIDDHERCSLSGREVTRRVAQSVMASLPTDWATRPRLTVIGSKEERSRVLADLAGHPLREACLVSDYDPAEPREAWAVADVGFPAGFGVYLQSPDGRVLARATSYEGRATLDRMDALRKPARPPFDPDRVPDPNKPAPPRPDAPVSPSPASPRVPWIPLGGLAAMGLLALVARPK